MINLTPWQQNYIRKAIHKSKINKPVRGYCTNDDVELDRFIDDLNSAYPDGGIDD